MANRNTLHILKLEDFKQWLIDNNIANRPGKGDWQVLQVHTLRFGWQCIFERADMPEHLTVQDRLMPLVNKFINERKA